MFDELTLGTELATAGKQVTQEHINIYADASGDQNPIHTDVEFAKGTMYGGTIAHGLYTLALLSEMLTEVFGNHWINSGTVDIAFLKPVRPGDTITAVTRLADLLERTSRSIGQMLMVTYETTYTNQLGQVVATQRTTSILY